MPFERAPRGDHLRCNVAFSRSCELFQEFQSSGLVLHLDLAISRTLLDFFGRRAVKRTRHKQEIFNFFALMDLRHRTELPTLRQNRNPLRIASVVTIQDCRGCDWASESEFHSRL